MDEQMIRQVIAEVIADKLAAPGKPVTVEVSARHVHLSQPDVEALFGPGHTLTPKRDLSQTGQFLCEERVRVVGPKGEYPNVAVLGPARGSTQVEMSRTDAKALGIEAPLRMSGDLRGAGDILIFAGARFVHARGSAIVAQNHIHMTPADAGAYGVADGDTLRVRVQSPRPLTFDDVAVRVHDSFRLAMHIDFDEANACMLDCGAQAEVLGAGTPGAPRAASCGCPAKAPAPAAVCTEKVVTAATAKALCAGGGKEVRVPKRTVVTPAALDVFRAAKVTIVRTTD